MDGGCTADQLDSDKTWLGDGKVLGGVLSRCGLAGTGHQGFLDIAEGEPGEVDLLRRWLGEVGFLGGPPG
jgi:hypothetical protein